MKANILLEDGKTFVLDCNLPNKTILAHIVFNTSMTGYQEIFTDPTYAGQVVLMTYPLIGNYGVNPEFAESDKVQVEGVILKEINEELSQYFIQNDVLCLSNFDTRMLTKQIRAARTEKCLITTDEIKQEHRERLKNFSGRHDLLQSVSRKEITEIKTKSRKRFAVVDCGVKRSILRNLENALCDMTLYPYDTDADVILRENYDAVLFSNGPGNPKDAVCTIELAKNLLGKLPLFGIGLGHQILGLALGADTYKLNPGHHGGNYPVLCEDSNKVLITSQNHGYAIWQNSMDKSLHITHKNVNDGTVEGFSHRGLNVYGVQFHPEVPPQDGGVHPIFEEWLEILEK